MAVYRHSEALLMLHGRNCNECDGERQDQALDGEAYNGAGDRDHPRRNTTLAEASRSFDQSPSEIEPWINDAKRGMESLLRANPLDLREQYGKQLQALH